MVIGCHGHESLQVSVELELMPCVGTSVSSPESDPLPVVLQSERVGTLVTCLLRVTNKKASSPCGKNREIPSSRCVRSDR